MGWSSKIFKRCKHKGQYHKDNAEDESSNNDPSLTEGSVECDKEETDGTAYYSFPDDGDGGRWNNITGHYHHHNYVSNDYIEAHHWGYDYEGQYKTVPYFQEVEHPSFASQQHYHIKSPYDNGSTSQLDPWFFPSYSSFPVCQTHIGDELSHSSCVWNPEHFDHIHESYFQNAAYEVLQDLFSENSTYHGINSQQDLVCYVCKELLQTGVDGRLQYREHPFWRQKYCPSHKHDCTPKCSSCKRLAARDWNMLSLGDAREICNDCQGAFTIMSTQDFQPIIREIKQFYKGLEMKVELNFPIRLVDLTEMDKEDEDSAVLCPVNLGLTSGKDQSIRIDVNIPKTGETGEIRKTDKKRLKLVGNHKVQWIRVLKGLPRIYTASILTHEMMHAWLFQEGHDVDMDLAVNEGTCQLMSYVWLESKVNSMLKSSFEWKLAKYIMHDIETRKDKIYGNGFRRAKKLLDRYGFEETLKIILFTGGFFDDFTR